MIKCRIAYILILLGMFGFYLFYSDYLSFLSLLFVLLLPVLLFVLVMLASRKLSAALTLESLSASRNGDFYVTVHLLNGSFLPLSRVRVSVHVENDLSNTAKDFFLMAPVGAHEEESVTWSMASQYCGQMAVSVTKLTVFDHFGLFLFSKNIDLHGAVYIVPDCQPISPRVEAATQVQIDSDLYSSTKPGDDSSETFGIREYAPGDSARSIHWKMSAKLDRMMIRQFGLPLNCSLFLLLELASENRGQRCSPEIIDNIIECVHSLSCYLTKNQIHHTICWYNEKKQRFTQIKITCESDLTLFMRELLASRCYQAPVKALQHYLGGHPSDRYSHFFYLTPIDEPAELNRVNLQIASDRTTVLQFVDTSSAATQNGYQADSLIWDATVIPVTTDTMKSKLDQLFI